MSGPKLTESGNLEEFLKRASAEIERATLDALPSKEPYKELYSIQKDYPLRGGKVIVGNPTNIVGLTLKSGSENLIK